MEGYVAPNYRGRSPRCPETGWSCSNAYNSHGCRCEKCLLWKQEFNGQYREYRRARTRRHLLIAVASAGGKCLDCGESYPLAVYDFHHRDPSKKDRKVANLLKHSLDRVLAEVRKCDLLCANCHRLRHWGSAWL